MSYEEIQNLCKWCHWIGIETVGDLAKFQKKFGLRTNKQTLDAVYAIYYTVKYEVAQ